MYRFVMIAGAGQIVGALRVREGEALRKLVVPLGVLPYCQRPPK